MLGAVNSMSGIGGTGFSSITGRTSSGSLVICDVYCMLRASALSFESLMMTLSSFRTGTCMLLSPDSLCLMHEYIFLWFSDMLIFRMLSL